ncbi:hypothetical protein HQ447_03690 [bacterium]|nr:hypothetical protein [bacterium]
MTTKQLLNGCGLAVFATLVAEAAAEAPAMREAMPYDQLVLARRKADLTDPMKRLAEAKGADPSVTNRPKSLLAESDILCFGGNAAMVPKRAILQIPQNHAARLKMQPGAKFLSWSEFYAANRGWITTVEVSRIQAEGKDPLPEATRTQMVKSGNLVVATYQGGPISVLPPPVPETPPEPNPIPKKP